MVGIIEGMESWFENIKKPMRLVQIWHWLLNNNQRITIRFKLFTKVEKKRLPFLRLWKKAYWFWARSTICSLVSIQNIRNSRMTKCFSHNLLSKRVLKKKKKHSLISFQPRCIGWIGKFFGLIDNGLRLSYGWNHEQTWATFARREVEWFDCIKVGIWKRII